jgi:hypothetical protein
MLEQVDYPVLIRSSVHFPGLQNRIPGLKVTDDMGPVGWNSAVLDISGQIKSHRLKPMA